MARIGANVDCELMLLAVLYNSVQANSTRGAFRADTAISQYMISV